MKSPLKANEIEANKLTTNITTIPNLLISATPEILTLNNFKFDVLYKEKLKLTNLMDFTIILNLVSSDPKKIYIRERIIKLSPLQTTEVTIKIIVSSVFNNVYFYKNTKNNFILVRNELMDMRIPVIFERKMMLSNEKERDVKTQFSSDRNSNRNSNHKFERVVSNYQYDDCENMENEIDYNNAVFNTDGNFDNRGRRLVNRNKDGLISNEYVFNTNSNCDPNPNKNTNKNNNNRQMHDFNGITKVIDYTEDFNSNNYNNNENHNIKQRNYSNPRNYNYQRKEKEREKQNNRNNKSNNEYIKEYISKWNKEASNNNKYNNNFNSNSSKKNNNPNNSERKQLSKLDIQESSNHNKINSNHNNINKNSYNMANISNISSIKPNRNSSNNKLSQLNKLKLTSNSSNNNYNTIAHKNDNNTKNQFDTSNTDTNFNTNNLNMLMSNYNSSTKNNEENDFNIDVVNESFYSLSDNNHNNLNNNNNFNNINKLRTKERSVARSGINSNTNTNIEGYIINKPIYKDPQQLSPNFNNINNDEGISNLDLGNNISNNVRNLKEVRVLAKQKKINDNKDDNKVYNYNSIETLGRKETDPNFNNNSNYNYNNSNKRFFSLNTLFAIENNSMSIINSANVKTQNNFNSNSNNNTNNKNDNNRYSEQTRTQDFSIPSTYQIKDYNIRNIFKELSDYLIQETNFLLEYTNEIINFNLKQIEKEDEEEQKEIDSYNKRLIHNNSNINEHSNSILNSPNSINNNRLFSFDYTSKQKNYNKTVTLFSELEEVTKQISNNTNRSDNSNINNNKALPLLITNFHAFLDKFTELLSSNYFYLQNKINSLNKKNRILMENNNSVNNTNLNTNNNSKSNINTNPNTTNNYNVCYDCLKQRNQLIDVNKLNTYIKDSFALFKMISEKEDEILNLKTSLFYSKQLNTNLKEYINNKANNINNINNISNNNNNNSRLVLSNYNRENKDDFIKNITPSPYIFTEESSHKNNINNYTQNNNNNEINEMKDFNSDSAGKFNSSYNYFNNNSNYNTNRFNTSMKKVLNYSHSNLEHNSNYNSGILSNFNNFNNHSNYNDDVKVKKELMRNYSYVPGKAFKYEKENSSVVSNSLNENSI